MHERFAMNIVLIYIKVIFIAYCNSLTLDKKCILQSIIEILLFILLENFDSQTASYIWIGHWYHITSICEGFHEPNSKAIES